MGKIIYEVVWLVTILVTPAALTFGWMRMFKRAQRETLFGWVALTSLLVATVSAALAVGALLYGGANGGWPFYDPRLLRVFGWGILISIAALTLGIVGGIKRSPLRWIAPLASFGMLLFWFGAATSE